MMNAIQQRMRPKHQVLVLKCYPRINKGAVDVKPNSSELSYLLFYATSRRSKIQKIGAFLEKKTAGDVSHMRIGNVQVTLAILAALVEKSPKEAALIAPTVLKILRLILGSNDITMIESSIPTFEAFCENHDPSSLFGDKDYLNQYEAVIRTYAQLASNKHRAASTAASRSVQIRWRNVGLSAIKCVSAADALSSLSGRQIDVIIPVILENLWSDNENFLDLVSDRLETEEKLHADNSSRRKNSIATIRTDKEAADTSPLAITGTATQVDNMAEEEAGVLALQCLKSIFVVPNQSQIYSATTSLMPFITERVADGHEKVIISDPSTGADSGPAIQILNIITRWAPVQDRYIILVVALDTMLGAALQENTLERHIVYAAMISSMLRSDLNLIGLSVMDVLHGLLRKMRKLLQLGSDSSSDKQVEDGPRNTKNLRHSLLARLEACVGDLATHVYYADQIWDMITAILIRLKPGPSSSTTSLSHAERVTTVQANGNGNHATTTEDPSAETSQNSQNDHNFSHTAGRLSALGAIKAVLLVSNPQKKVSGNVDLSRSRLPIQVWENTQWLLQDPDGNVRMAYVKVLLTWLDRETVSQDCNADDDDDDDVSDKFASSCRYNHDGYGVHSRRAVSNASQREKKCKNNHMSHFLSMLHLAIYDSALQLVDFDGDMCLLHALLSRLVAKLGINAVRFGLPMIFRLQEEIQEVEMPVQKVRIAALCHGYFLTITDKFQLGKSNVGRMIGNEVARRRQTQFWVQGITVPPQPLEKIGPLGRAGEDPGWDIKAVETGELLPFDDRISLVESIASAYRSAIQSPPGSPTGSSRLCGQAGHGPSSIQATHQSKRDSKLPRRYRHQLLHEWSRESIKAAIAAQQKADSVAGSKTGTGTTRGNRQNINNAASAAPNGTQNQMNDVPASSYDSLPNQRPQTAQTQGAGDRLGTHGKLRKSSIRSARGGSPSTGGHGHKAGGVVSVDQLKMMLSSNVSPRDAGIPVANVDDGDDGDDDDDGDEEEDSAESMVSYDYTLSEVSFNPATTGASAQDDNGSSSPTGTSGQETGMKRNVSNSSRSGTPQQQKQQQKQQQQQQQQQQRSLERRGGGGLEAANNGVVVERETTGGEGSNKMASPPPLPPLPSVGSLANLSSGKKQYVMQDGSLKPPRNRRTSSGGNREGGGRAVSGSSSSGAGRAMDLQDLLRGIDSSCGQGSMGNVSRPPY